MIHLGLEMGLCDLKLNQMYFITSKILTNIHYVTRILWLECLNVLWCMKVRMCSRLWFLHADFTTGSSWSCGFAVLTNRKLLDSVSCASCIATLLTVDLFVFGHTLCLFIKQFNAQSYNAVHNFSVILQLFLQMRLVMSTVVTDRQTRVMRNTSTPHGLFSASDLTERPSWNPALSPEDLLYCLWFLKDLMQ